MISFYLAILLQIYFHNSLYAKGCEDYTYLYYNSIRPYSYLEGLTPWEKDIEVENKLKGVTKKP